MRLAVIVVAVVSLGVAPNWAEAAGNCGCGAPLAVASGAPVCAACGQCADACCCYPGLIPLALRGAGRIVVGAGRVVHGTLVCLDQALCGCGRAYCPGDCGLPDCAAMAAPGGCAACGAPAVEVVPGGAPTPEEISPGPAPSPPKDARYAPSLQPPFFSQRYKTRQAPHSPERRVAASRSRTVAPAVYVSQPKREAPRQAARPTAEPSRAVGRVTFRNVPHNPLRD